MMLWIDHSAWYVLKIWERDYSDCGNQWWGYRNGPTDMRQGNTVGTE